MRHSTRFFGALAAIWLASPVIGLAHHAMGGRTPATLVQGLLSGIAHPVLGLDHFAVIVAIGVLAAAGSGTKLIPYAFIAAAFAGTGLHLLELNLPLANVIAAVSAVGFGAAILTGRLRDPRMLTAAACAAGLFHGYAYGESIVGAETTPLAGYLVGLALIQVVIALGARGLARFASEHLADRGLGASRALGTAIGLGGIILLVIGV